MAATLETTHSCAISDKNLVFLNNIHWFVPNCPDDDKPSFYLFYRGVQALQLFDWLFLAINHLSPAC